MKKIKYMIFMLLALFIVTNVNAECDYKKRLEINTKAANVTAEVVSETITVDREGNVYENYEGETTEENGIVQTTVFSLNVANIAEGIYVRVYNEDENLDVELHASDLEDGKYVYNVPDVLKIRTFDVDVFDETGECEEDILRSIEVKSPMYNEVSGSRICQNNIAYFCQEFVTTEIDVDPYEYMQNHGYGEEEQEETEEPEEQKSIMPYLYMAGIGVAVLLVIAIIVVIIIRRRKKKKLMMGVNI